MSRKQAVRRRYYLKYRAFDYKFLAEYFGLEVRNATDEEDERDFDPTVDAIEKFLDEIVEEHWYTCMGWNDSCICRQRKVANDIRIYLKNMSKSKYSYEAPMWKGMSKIKNDSSLLRVFRPLISYAWD